MNQPALVSEFFNNKTDANVEEGEKDDNGISKDLAAKESEKIKKNGIEVTTQSPSPAR